LSMRSALVVGGDGLIARSLTAHLTAHSWQVICTSRREKLTANWLQFDLNDGVDSLSKSLSQKVEVVFICAALTGYAPCANDPIGSRQVNVIRTVELGRHFMTQGARIVYLSSNAVFDGTRQRLDEHAPTNPITEYGRQKADCESALLHASTELPGSCVVVRLTKVVDKVQPLFSEWTQNFNAQIPVKAAIDLVVCPVTTTYVATALQFIASSASVGVFHLSGERDMTYHELATAVASIFCEGCAVEMDFVQKRLGTVPSPLHSALSMARTTALLGLKPQHLTEVARELTGCK